MRYLHICQAGSSLVALWASRGGKNLSSDSTPSLVFNTGIPAAECIVFPYPKFAVLPVKATADGQRVVASPDIRKSRQKRRARVVRRKAEEAGVAEGRRRLLLLHVSLLCF